MNQYLVKKLNKATSFFLLVATIALVVFMVGQTFFIVTDIYYNFIEILSVAPKERFALVSKLNIEYLHMVSLMILIVKAYKILTSYVGDHHVDIKYMIEIAIIGSMLELLFNSGDYTAVMQIVFAGLGLGGAVIYHYWYHFDGRFIA